MPGALLPPDAPITSNPGILLSSLRRSPWWVLTAHRIPDKPFTLAPETLQWTQACFPNMVPRLWAPPWGACHSPTPRQSVPCSQAWAASPSRMPLPLPGSVSPCPVLPGSAAMGPPCPPFSALPPSGSELTSRRPRTPLGSSHSPGSGRLPGGSASSESLRPAAGKSCPSTTCREMGQVRAVGRPGCPPPHVPGTPRRCSSQQTRDTGNTIVPISQMRKLRHRDAKLQAQGYTLRQAGPGTQSQHFGSQAQAFPTLPGKYPLRKREN